MTEFFPGTNAVRMIALNPGASEADFEQFMRDELFPSIAYMYHAATSPGSVLLKSSFGQGPTMYLWLKLDGLSAPGRAFLLPFGTISQEIATKLQSFGESFSFDTAIGVTPVSPPTPQTS